MVRLATFSGLRGSSEAVQSDEQYNQLAAVASLDLLVKFWEEMDSGETRQVRLGHQAQHRP